MTGRAARGFASDNQAGIHPAVLAAIAAANEGHASSYGHDGWTERVQARFREHFGPEAQAFPVFNGTGANVLSLRAACRPWEAAICTDTAHLNVDEGGAPEVIGGIKLLTVEGIDGKLTPELVSGAALARQGDEHQVQARVVSIAQSTELGTVYSIEETKALADAAHAHGLVLHVDGARLSNAAAALELPLRALTAEAGVDIVSFGGTKNGLLGAEAVVFLTPELAEGFLYLRKQSLQLASKMRFLAAQLDALLTDELFRELAAHANAMAARLAAAVVPLPGITITRRVEANAVFAILPPGAAERLQERFAFYVWDERSGEVRWMCAWDTTAEDVDTFAAAVADVSAP
ncbi:MAG TPA: beta-eliminating lyase-related protein [Solirubrobacteraceae bacterium]|jgi:threonine aldolase|nr:beta-eliminating lyase-related protein [Solirubrobacteraceae bacterium]